MATSQMTFSFTWFYSCYWAAEDIRKLDKFCCKLIVSNGDLVLFSKWMKKQLEIEVKLAFSNENIQLLERLKKFHYATPIFGWGRASRIECVCKKENAIACIRKL